MAENKERKIVYYKGRSYYLIKLKDSLCELEDTSNSSVKRTVSAKLVLTPEEFERVKDSRRSEHQMNIASPGRSKR